MKHFYIAVTVKQNKNEVLFDDPGKEYEPGYYAYMVKCSEGDNLKTVLDGIGGLLHANLCTTKKKAVDLVNHWNACYKVNGTYLYDNPNLF